MVEDYVRFVLDDPPPHRPAQRPAASAHAPPWRHCLDDRLAARETQADVGTNGHGRRTVAVRGWPQVLTANFGRLQEALRSLEEFAKIERRAELAAEFEQIRYQTYTLQRAVTTPRRHGTAGRRPAVRARRRPRDAEEFAALVQSLIAAGVDVIQLRDKRLNDRTLLARARLLRA